MDSSLSVGGTWAKERLYPGLKTNNLVGSYEFSDFALQPTKYGVEEGRHIPGAAVHQYLCDFAAHYAIPLRLGTEVTTATLLDSGQWQVGYKTSPNSNGACPPHRSLQESQLLADKLVLATGLTSEPSIPSFVGEESYKEGSFTLSSSEIGRMTSRRRRRWLSWEAINRPGMCVIRRHAPAPRSTW